MGGTLVAEEPAERPTRRTLALSLLLSSLCDDLSTQIWSCNVLGVSGWCLECLKDFWKMSGGCVGGVCGGHCCTDPEYISFDLFFR